MENIENNNQDLVETNIRIIGNKRPITQVVQLLAYIRHAIKYNIQTDIKISIGKNVANTNFLFDVNGLEIPDLITQKEVEIN